MLFEVIDAYGNVNRKFKASILMKFYSLKIRIILYSKVVLQHSDVNCTLYLLL